MAHAHWTALPAPGEGSGYDTEAVAETAGEHAAIACSTAATAGLLTTLDGGRHWHVVAGVRNGTGVYYTDLGFENDRDGSVIYGPAIGSGAPGELLRTSDGGASWHPVAY